MLCQNCGRRSSDTLNFCAHCGAIASPDPPTSLSESRRAPAARFSRLSVPPPDPGAPKYKISRQPTSARQGASGFSRLVFFALAFGMVYWFTKTDDFDLITFIRSAIESKLSESSSPPVRDVRPVPTTPEQPASSAPAVPPPAAATSTTRRTREPASASDSRPPTVGTARPGPPPEIEGLTSAQVERVLGAPNRQVVGGDGVTVWVYQNGALIVYFYKDRATLKPPR